MRNNTTYSYSYLLLAYLQLKVSFSFLPIHSSVLLFVLELNAYALVQPVPHAFCWLTLTRKSKNKTKSVCP